MHVSGADPGGGLGDTCPPRPSKVGPVPGPPFIPAEATRNAVDISALHGTPYTIGLPIPQFLRAATFIGGSRGSRGSGPPFGPRCRLFNIVPKIGSFLNPPFFVCRPKMDPPPFQKSWIRPWRCYARFYFFLKSLKAGRSHASSVFMEAQHALVY